jgi:glutaryl-CoA dehydrogenase
VEITSILKHNSCGKALNIARLVRDTRGGNGLNGEFCLARHLVNLDLVNS